ncbi:multidrug effflux MFS transporter [Roseomonas sp. NAR14]|uniref:Bcr/CflA family efflux transporter n=1 Tax=Roseomonas acroporae TaxID=2937791 RepID=A0A9X1YB41_9PROT|nr:multidrug effflux MFS transporter [Roseomonas acroporae]MCK8786445.1 multidrug effflux MFS transporter [Roseomonas acroporae]
MDRLGRDAGAPAAPGALHGSAAAPRTPPPFWLLVLVTASGTLGMHIFIPALPEAAAELGVGAGAAQLTITLYMLGLAAGQLVYGPVSDRTGRRPALLAGLGLYTLGCLGALLANSLGALLAARLVQSLGGCAGLALGRAIVRDTAEPRAAAARLALLNLVLSASPGLSPVLGGWLAVLFGWRAVFAAMLALALLTLALVLWRLPETASPGQGSGGGSPAALLRGYGRLLRQPAFLGYVVGGGLATTSIYAFMAASPFIFVEELHRPVHEVGYYYFILILGMTLGSFLANRLLQRLAMGTLLRLAGGVALLGAALFLGAVLAGRLSVVTAVAPVFLFVASCGLAAPVALTKAISVDPKAIGAAAGLYGCGQMVIGALCTVAAGFGGDPALASACVLLTAALLSQLAFTVALRHDRRD